MFDYAHAYESYRCVKWGIKDPEHRIAQYKNDIGTFVAALQVPGLACAPEQINIGGAILGRTKIEAVVTRYAGSLLYGVSFGLAYGQSSVVLVTLRCAANLLAGGAPDAYEKAQAASCKTVKGLTDFFFLDKTMERMHDSAID